MPRKYLKTGEEISIEAEVDNFIFCRKVYIDEFKDEHVGNIIKVNRNDVFISPPIEKINSDVKIATDKLKDIEKSISDKNTELRNLNSEISKVTKTQLDNQKFIINRSDLLNATSIALFPKDRIEPYTIFKKDNCSNFRGLKITLEISIDCGGERSWGYKLYYDQHNNYGEYLDENYGFIINPTEEDIIQHSFLRQQKTNFDNSNIKRCPDKYLTPINLEKKKGILAQEKDFEIKKKQELIEKTKLELEKL